MTIYLMTSLNKNTFKKVFFSYIRIGDFMQITFEEITKRQNIIDIRSSLDFKEGNILGSLNIPRLVLMSNPQNYMNKKDEYYLLCDKGKVSLMCAKVLNALGYKCYSIIGGIENIKKL